MRAARPNRARWVGAIVIPSVLAALALPTLGVASAVGQEPDGRALYQEHCRTCHGSIGTPPKRALAQYKDIPILADSAFQAGLTDDSILVVLREGKGKDMKSFADKLSDTQMRAVVRYVRTLARPGRP